MNENQIERYLGQDMSEDERLAFEQELAQDASLRKRLLLEKDLQAGIAQLGHAALRDRLRRIHEEEIGTEGEGATVVPLHSRAMLRRWAAVALMLIVALGLLYWSVNSGASDPAALYASNYEPYQLELTQRGGGEQSRMQAAEDAYRSGDFAAALPLLEELQAADPQDAQLGLALAITHWERGEEDVALRMLSELSGHPLLSDQANWYRGLILLKEGQSEAAKAALEEVAKEEGSHLANKATTLLEKLK